MATFSIVAFDPDTQELGVAVASKFIAVGAVAPWAKARVGAVATQAWANTTYGPRGIELMAEGVEPREVVERLTAGDDKREERQVGVVDARGRAATFTGRECREWAGGRTGECYAVQGNMLAGERVIDAIAEAFEKAGGELGERLLAALAAGEAAGGDKRGRQSAALLIVREGWGYGGYNDRYRDLRVDDHDQPIEELSRIYRLHQKAFPRPEFGAVMDAVRTYTREKWNSPLVDIDLHPIPAAPGLYAANCEFEAGWWGSLLVFRYADGKVEWSAEFEGNSGPTEQSLLSVRPLKLPQVPGPVVEVFGQTHMGNGNLYLYELRERKLRLLLGTWAVDQHWGGDGAVIRGGSLSARYEDADGDGAADVVLSGVIDKRKKDDPGSDLGDWPAGEWRRYRRTFLWRPDPGGFVESADKEPE